MLYKIRYIVQTRTFINIITAYKRILFYIFTIDNYINTAYNIAAFDRGFYTFWNIVFNIDRVIIFNIGRIIFIYAYIYIFAFSVSNTYIKSNC